MSLTGDIMTRRWKLKTNSSNILLVLITLILVKAEWVEEERVDSINAVGSDSRTQIYVGNDEIAHYFFGASTKNDSFILEDVSRCLENFQLVTCVKMLLLNQVNEVMHLVEEPHARGKDLQALNGVLTIRVKNTTNPGETIDGLGLDEEIALKVRKIFQRRLISVNVLPNVKIEIEPLYDSKDNFLPFRYAIQQSETEGRGKKGGMPMMMIIPPLIMMGLMPFTLASLKAMVMNAVMINMMALNGAIFMTIRNLVFGPRKGDNVKYVNYGYSKDRQTQSRRPVLIIHSPAAFVKQPPVHKKRRPPTYFPQHFSSEGSSYSYQLQNVHGYENKYYTA